MRENVPLGAFTMFRPTLMSGTLLFRAWYTLHMTFMLLITIIFGAEVASHEETLAREFLSTWSTREHGRKVCNGGVLDFAVRTAFVASARANIRLQKRGSGGREFRSCFRFQARNCPK